MGRCFTITLLAVAGLLGLLTPQATQAQRMRVSKEAMELNRKKDKAYYFAAAKDATTKREYQRSLRILERYFALKEYDPKTPAAVWELVALNFEKLGSPKLALVNLFRAIKVHHPHTHDQILQQYKEGDSADEISDVPKGLLSIYFKLARNFAAIAISSDPSHQQKAADVEGDKRLDDLEYALSQARMYVEICVSNEYREDESEKMRDTIIQWAQERERKLFHGRFFAGVGYASWQDKLTLVSASNGSETELLSTSEGPCLGGGYQSTNFYWGWKLEGCLALATANVGENSRQVEYFQEGVPVTAFITSPGIFYRPLSGEVSLGLELPILVRQGDYTTPEGGHTLDQTSLVTLGVGGELRWFYSNIDFAGKVTKFLELPSVMWMAMGHYNF